MSMTKAGWIAAILLAASCLLGCASRSLAYSTTTVTSAPPLPDAPAAADFKPSSISLYIAEKDLPNVCGARRTMAPTHFERGAEEIAQEDYLGLRELSLCLTTGPLGTSRARLVGQTEPRESKATLELGLARAVRVKQALMELGVGDDRIEVASEGDTLSRTQDPSTWADARRVDILILPPLPR